MKLKSIVLTTCLSAITALLPINLHAQEATPGAPPAFGPDKGPKERGEGRGKPNPAERLAKLKDTLALTPDQETKIRDIFQSEMEKVRAARLANKDAKPAPEERRAKMKAIRDEVAASIKAVLTPEQLAKWESMKKNRGPKHEEAAEIPRP